MSYKDARKREVRTAVTEAGGTDDVLTRALKFWSIFTSRLYEWVCMDEHHWPNLKGVLPLYGDEEAFKTACPKWAEDDLVKGLLPAIRRLAADCAPAADALIQEMSAELDLRWPYQGDNGGRTREGQPRLPWEHADTPPIGWKPSS